MCRTVRAGAHVRQGGLVGRVGATGLLHVLAEDVLVGDLELLLLLDQLESQRLVRAARDDAVAVAIVGKHGRRDSRMLQVEVILLGERHGSFEDRGEFQIASVPLRRGFAHATSIIPAFKG